MSIGVEDGECVFNTNAIPNHDFNDGRGFPNEVREQDDVFEITSMPTLERTITALSLIYDNAIMLNGVKVDLLAASTTAASVTTTSMSKDQETWMNVTASRLMAFMAITSPIHTPT